MIDFYNAFISYRHAKLDSAIAEHLVKQLEHFHVPHKLKKNLRHQKITRIFRDKDELPITSDLTETITNALEKAEYLIVICSTNTKESIWVKREINTFLQTHTKDKILTVLCDGEPEEVIPQELLSMEKEYVDENGFTHKITIPVEPLSCDYRLPRSRADKEELPRLASALLGCSYDELLRRRRQYAIRRAAIVVAAVFLALSSVVAYALYSRQKINENYIESLRNKSIYLANASDQLLEEDKRVDAVHIALEALPKDDKDKMPETAQAIRALTDATAAYISNSGNNYAPAWNYKTEHRIDFCDMSENHVYVGAMDKSGTVYCWDTKSHHLVFRKDGEYEPVDMVFLGDETIMIVYPFKLDAYNVQTGSLMWTYELGDTQTMTGRGQAVYVNGSVYLDIGKGQVGKLSARDGSVKEVYQVKDDGIFAEVDCLAVSPDGKKLAYSDSAFIFSEDYKVHIFDTETKKSYDSNIDTYYIEKIKFVDNEHLCVMSTDSINMSWDMSEESTFVISSTLEMHVYDMALKELWTDELVYNTLGNDYDTFTIPSRNAVLFYAGNIAGVYNLNTGELLNIYRTNGSILKSDDYNKNGLPEFITRSGEYVYATSPDNNNLMVNRSLASPISIGLISDTIYAVPSYSMDLISYNRMLQDDEWKAVKAPGEFILGSDYQASYYDDEYLIIGATINDTEGIRISVIDLENAKLVFSEDVEAGSGLSTCFDIKLVDDEIYGFFGNKIYTIDPDKEKVTPVDVEIDNYKDDVSNGKIIRCSIDFDSNIEMTVSDIDGSNEVEFSEQFDDLSVYDLRTTYYVESLDTVLIPVGRRLFAANLESSEIEEIELPDIWMVTNSNKFFTKTSDDGSLVLISDGNTILVTDSSFEEKYSFRCNCQYRCSVVFIDDILYIVADDYIMLYKSKTGEFINKYSITLFGKGDLDLLLDEKNNLMFVHIGDQLSVFDTNTWIEIAFVENCYCYYPESDCFFVYSFFYDTECTPGYIKHYTLEDLKAKAEKYLGDHELDADTKSKYGLG